MFKLSKKGQEFVQSELNRYEDKHSAIIPCLYKAQEENGWISNEVINYLSELMDIPTSKISEVSTFYTMFNKKPVGKFHVQVCCNISCSMENTREMLASFCERYNVKEEEITKDGLFTFTRVECLGSCGTAPMMQINDQYYEDLTLESAHNILEGLK